MAQETADVSSIRLRKDEMQLLNELMRLTGSNRSRAVGEAVVHYLYAIKRQTVRRQQVESMREMLVKKSS